MEAADVLCRLRLFVRILDVAALSDIGRWDVFVALVGAQRRTRRISDGDTEWVKR